MVTLIGRAQNPGEGVNIYVPEAVLSIIAGDQVPVMPLGDVVGRIGTAPPKQITGAMLNEAVRRGLTVMVKVVEVAHSPAVGVNV